MEQIGMSKRLRVGVRTLYAEQYKRLSCVRRGEFISFMD